jgi:hypothetical protein
MTREEEEEGVRGSGDDVLETGRGAQESGSGEG